jgi:hypothetical protein
MRACVSGVWCVWYGWFRRLAVGIGVCGVCGYGRVWVRMCVRWYAGRDGMVWVSPAWHGLLCGCCDGERACVVDGVCVCVRAWLYVATRLVRWMDVWLWIVMGADDGATCVVWWVDVWCSGCVS